MNLLCLPQVSDQTNMALACWGPEMLMHARISEMEEIMGCYLETLERRGRLVATDRTPMLESFVRFISQFRDDHGEDYDLQTQGASCGSMDRGT